jgi:hypothetical protein
MTEYGQIAFLGVLSIFSSAFCNSDLSVWTPRCSGRGASSILRRYADPLPLFRP